MHKIIAAALLTVGLSACASGVDKAGIRDPDEFARVATRTYLVSPHSARTVADCFEARAALLPMTTIRPVGDSGAIVYRLRGFGFSFEEILFEDRPGGGSTATVLIAPNLNARWRADFDRDRLGVLEACAAA